jgi:hypothetical protein
MSKQAAGIELTKFSKVGGLLTKRISLTPDGKLLSHGSACVMSDGTAERVRIASVGELATLIAKLSLPSNRARRAACRPARQGGDGDVPSEAQQSLASENLPPAGRKKVVTTGVKT